MSACRSLNDCLTTSARLSTTYSGSPSPETRRLATIPTGTPPTLPTIKGKKSHGHYRPWLVWTYFDRVCCYCLLRNTAAHIDHYVPESYDPKRADDPTNLLLICPL